MQQRSIALAYVLWFFLGQIGIHRFYTGRVGTGIMQLL
ncbi:MAG TPA: TM2 domain-containing protein [Virgibacillus sp.]|nr:TM2 domain-containing protein [Virgibacillus sp.]HLR69791.1 TM2 domain-containing protein [Virgibacillus sp.]